MSNKKKTKRNEIMINNKIIIGIAVIILLFTMLFIFKPKNKNLVAKNELEKIELGEFEKIAVYDMLKESYFEDGLLYIMSGQYEPTIEETKYIYATEEALKNNGKANIEEIYKEYERIFGEKLKEENKSMMIQSINEKEGLEYNETEKTVEKREDEKNENEKNRLRYYVIKDISKENDTYIIELEIRKVEKSKLYSYFSSYQFAEENSPEKAQEILEKIQAENASYDELYNICNKLINEENLEEYTKKYGTGRIGVRISEGRYILEKYEENPEK